MPLSTDPAGSRAGLGEQRLGERGLAARAVAHEGEGVDELGGDLRHDASPLEVRECGFFRGGGGSRAESDSPEFTPFEAVAPPVRTNRGDRSGTGVRAAWAKENASLSTRPSDPARASGASSAVAGSPVRSVKSASVKPSASRSAFMREAERQVGRGHVVGGLDRRPRPSRLRGTPWAA